MPTRCNIQVISDRQFPHSATDTRWKSVPPQVVCPLRSFAACSIKVKVTNYRNEVF